MPKMVATSPDTFVKDSRRWGNDAVRELYDGKIQTLRPPTLLAVPHTFDLMFAGPLYKPEALMVKESDKEIHVILAADVLFHFDKATIRPDAASALKEAGLMIHQHSGNVRIEGHTDSKGGSAYNVNLSNQRAIAVETWLVRDEGSEIATFSTRGFGATRPVAPNTKPDGSDNSEGRQLNRRVELVMAK